MRRTRFCDMGQDCERRDGVINGHERGLIGVNKSAGPYSAALCAVRERR